MLFYKNYTVIDDQIFNVQHQKNKTSRYLTHIYISNHSEMKSVNFTDLTNTQLEETLRENTNIF